MKTKKRNLVPDTWNEEYHHVRYVLPSGGEYYHVERWQLDVVREDCNLFGIPFVNVSNLIAHLQGHAHIFLKIIYILFQKTLQVFYKINFYSVEKGSPFFCFVQEKGLIFFTSAKVKPGIQKT